MQPPFADLPFAALKAFAAAARLSSFRDAASALGVTPSAISHQVQALEAWVGAPLFERGVRQVRLTPQGEQLSRALNAALEDMTAALNLARASSVQRELKIAALPLFVSVWLAPRLARFEAAFPNLSLTIDTHPRLADLTKGEADIAIRNVPSPTQGLEARKLLDLHATPLCTPELAATFASPKDLAGATLIGLNVGRAGWPDWFAAAGVGPVKLGRTLKFDTMPEAIAAAAQGRGVLLGLLPLTWDAPGADKLIAPFAGHSYDAGTYFVVWRKQDNANSVVRAFADWMIQEMRSDLKRLKRRRPIYRPE